MLKSFHKSRDISNIEELSEPDNNRSPQFENSNDLHRNYSDYFSGCCGNNKDYELYSKKIDNLKRSP